VERRSSSEGSFDLDFELRWTAITAQISALATTGFTIIGDAPAGSLNHWPERVTDCVIATGPSRDHWRSKHPELLERSLEIELVRAVIDPDSIHRGQHPGQSHTAIFFRRIDERNDIVVVVSIATDPIFLNSVITARKQKTKTRERREQKFGVWTRE
jgi:hypothetical protein